MNKIIQIAAIAVVLVTTISFAQEENAKSSGNEIRHGIRIAFGNANFEDYYDDITYYAIGWIMSYPIANTITFNPGLNFAYGKVQTLRVPEGWNWRDVDITEFAFSVPLLFQAMPFGGPLFYLEGGVQLDIPLLTDTYDNRANFDFGIALGFGWHAGENLGFDIRIVKGLTDFDDKGEKPLIQGYMGLSYLF
jgi:hypothetical protein